MAVSDKISIILFFLTFSAAVLTDALKRLKQDQTWEQDPDAHLKPDSIAHVSPHPPFSYINLISLVGLFVFDWPRPVCSYLGARSSSCSWEVVIWRMIEYCTRIQANILISSLYYTCCAFFECSVMQTKIEQWLLPDVRTRLECPTLRHWISVYPWLRHIGADWGSPRPASFD